MELGLLSRVLVRVVLESKFLVTLLDLRSIESTLFNLEDGVRVELLVFSYRFLDEAIGLVEPEPDKDKEHCLKVNSFETLIGSLLFRKDR